jgi:dihydroxyacid dehydratase/phosphogluconate dehydratase
VNWNEDVILPLEKALTSKKGGIAVLKGNLAPKGAVLKPSAATPHLMHHIGPRRRVRGHRRLQGAINDDALDIDESCVMVLKNCGAEGLSRHGRGRQHGPAAQGPEKGSPTWSGSRTRACRAPPTAR